MRAAIAIAIGLVACGNGDEQVDLAGVYRVDSEAVADLQQGATSCSDTQPITGAPAYIRLDRIDAGSATAMAPAGYYFRYASCPDATGAGCVYDGGLGFFTDSFLDPVSGGWQTVAYGIDVDAGSCSVTADFYTALLHGSALAIEADDLRMAVGSGGSDECTPTESEQLGSSMPCEGRTVVAATLVTPL